MTEYHAEQWKANGIPGEVAFLKPTPATNPHKALWMLLSACSFGAAGVGLRSLQNSERQLADYEAIAEKRDLAKGEITARGELLDDYRGVAISEVHLQADLEAAANDRAVVLKQCEVLGEADIKIVQLDAEEAIFEAETAGLSDDKKQEYMEFLRNQKTPFLLTGTQTLAGITNPGDKVDDRTEGAIEPEPEQTDGPKIPKLIWYPSVLVYGAPGAGKTFFSEQEVSKRLAAGHRVVVLDPHAAYGAWQGCEVIGGGMDYPAIDAKLAWFAEEVAKRYKVVQTQPNPKFQPLTFVCDEFTRWGGKCPNSTDFFEQLVTDIRKVEMFGLIISHTRTLAGLANAKGFASLRDEALLEVEILGDKDEETGRATPRFEAKIKLPGQLLSDRTLVKLTKHPTPNKPEPTSQNTSAESTTDYLNRVFKLEFDLGKPETESETVSDDFQNVKQPHSSNSSDSDAVYFTALKLDRARASELILKLKNEMKHTQTEIIWMLWNARPGKTKAYEMAVSEYKELLAE
ncbi:type IV secretory system conjugative DNA transfer family protein [Microcoleus sp. herbarium7]|uniref:type IV secretory system conjugative DNA transfer family protein n=1 Tax=Microcoleus sp. herbarium7 TaxID=3055435 RepID=UPI002FCF614C